MAPKTAIWKISFSKNTGAIKIKYYKHQNMEQAAQHLPGLAPLPEKVVAYAALLPETTVLPAPEKIFLRPIAPLLRRSVVAIALVRIIQILIKRIGRENLSPQAFRPIENA
ncbi:MAG: hypothetical protein ACRECY_14235 [Phyllobacterium sp.]